MADQIQRSDRSFLLRSRLRDLTARVRTNQMVRRMGKWIDSLQADLRGVANDGLHNVGTITSRVARQLLMPTADGPRPIVNATDVLTGVGVQLPLADAAIEDLALVARDYCGCESPSLASSDDLLRSAADLVADLTGAEAAIVFANSAGATIAALTALAREQEVIVARGHVERLHGDFALPAAAATAQATLCEVGVTHRATILDYRQVMSPRAAAIIYSQPAEFQISGAVAQATIEELVDLAAEHRVPLLASLPCSTLIPLDVAGVNHLPVVGQTLLAGADLVLFRGDTCLGGPPCAILAGRRRLIDHIAAEPLAAVFAADPLAVTALIATLRLYTTPETAMRSVPLLQLLGASTDNLKHRAQRLTPQLRQSSAVGEVEVLPGQSWLTPARLADERLASWCLRVEARNTNCARLARDLAAGMPGIWLETDGNCLRLNLRSVLPRQDEQIVAAFHALGTSPSQPDISSRSQAPAEQGTDTISTVQ